MNRLEHNGHLRSVTVSYRDLLVLNIRILRTKFFEAIL